MKLKFYSVVAVIAVGVGVAAAQGPAGYIGNMHVKQVSASGAAVSQDTSKSDEAITKQVRASIAADKSLSDFARGVKVSTQGGRVTLKGSVGSDAERVNIVAKAAAVAGNANVNNQLAVMMAKS